MQDFNFDFNGVNPEFFGNYRPFAHPVVHSPWHDVVDVPSLHKDVKDEILRTVDGCTDESASRILTIVGPPGYGKTHLLSWTRAQFDRTGKGFFIFVTPYRPGESKSATLEQHVIKSVFESVRLRSPRQRQFLIDRVRKHLLKVYDDMVIHRRYWSLRSDLGISVSFFTALLRRPSLTISHKPKKLQDPALSKALQKRPFIDQSFQSFAQTNLPNADGVRHDRDMFIAVCLLAAGNQNQQEVADQWINGELYDEDHALYHFSSPCLGTDKIRDGLFTVMQLAGQPFCLAFDQIEETFLSFSNVNVSATKEVGHLFGRIFGELSRMPGFVVLFMVNAGYLSEMEKDLPKWLRDRMRGERGTQTLNPLNDDTAYQLVCQRMQSIVWDKQPGLERPIGEPSFPFSKVEIEELRHKNHGELRGLLHSLQQEYEKKLKIRPTLQLLSVDPAEVTFAQPTQFTIHAQNLPRVVQVLFDGIPISEITLRVSDGIIQFPITPQSRGELAIQVTDTDDSKNTGIISIHSRLPPIQKPYRLYVDPEKLKKRRNDLRHTQAHVAKELGLSPGLVGKIERGQATTSDETYEKLAELYEMPLSFFVKESSV